MKAHFVVPLTLCLAVQICAAQNNEPTTREMNLISWQEFQQWVPGTIETVLLPVGTLEAHGVIPNGADNLAPEAMSRSLADRLNALIAPTLNYGVTGSLKGYAGTFAISEAAYRAFVTDILKGLAGNGFKNIIILNGHGGPQTAILRSIISEISEQHRVRTLAINWWSLASDVTFEVFGENGGHAGNNETAYVQHIVPNHIHPDRYSAEMATPSPANNGWSAFPFPSSIILYEENQGYPGFDANQAQEYFDKVNEKVLALIMDVIRKWDSAGLYRD